jgi:hypothetical protein
MPRRTKATGRRSKTATRQVAVERSRSVSAIRNLDRESTTWGLLFAGEEALLDHAIAVVGDEARLAVSANEVPAKLAIAWTDPTFPIFYNVRINGVSIGPPNQSRGGREIRDIVLQRGRNRLDWNIFHSSQGWKNQVFLKVGDIVQRLETSPEQDQSPQPGDDISRGVNVEVEV